MWLKFIFALSYVLIVFIFSRVIDVAVKTYDMSSLTLIPTRIIVDPISLSVKHLKSVLNQRGVSYTGVVEKQDLHQLVQSSGEVTREEVEEATLIQEDNHEITVDSTEPPTSTVELSSGSHFYEVVEDTKDSAWIVLVVPFVSGAAAVSLISDEWKNIVKKASLFGIRTALFDCSSDEFFCESRRWSSPRLLLALPKNVHQSKSDVVLKQYILGNRVSISKIFHWIHTELVSRVTKVNNLSAWIKDSSEETKVLLVTNLTSPPLFFSALAVKFTGRASFGLSMLPSREESSKHSFAKYSILVSNRTTYTFEKTAGEIPSFKSMELLMKTMIPEMNDIFLLNLLLVNIASCLDFFWIKCSKVWKHMMYWAMRVIKANIILFLCWLILLTVCGLPSVKPFLSLFMEVTQLLSQSLFMKIIRHDALYYYKMPVLCSSFIVLSSFIYFSRRKYFCHGSHEFDDEQLFRDWTPLESRILNYILFRPIGLSVHPIVSNINLEEGMEQLIERLAVPNLWLQADFVSTEYIKDLPVWLYSGSDDEENYEGDVSSSSQVVSESEQVPDLTPFKTSQDNNSEESVQATKDAQIPSSSSSSKFICFGSRKVTSISKKTDSSVIFKEEDKRQDVEASSQRVAPSGILPCKECAICLESFKRNHRLCGLPCGHSYHESCILPWLFRDNHICPSCRWPTNKRKKIKTEASTVSSTLPSVSF